MGSDGQTPGSTLDRVRRALNGDFEMSNRSTPAKAVVTSDSKKSTLENDEEWKTPRKDGYPDSSPRSHAMKWLKSEEALLTFLTKFVENFIKNLMD